MDGVLVDSSYSHHQAYMDLWQQCGLDGPDYNEIAGRPTHEVVSTCTQHLNPTRSVLERWVTFKQERARHYLASEPVAFEDTLPCLRAIQRHGIGMAVATGASRVTAKMLLDRLAIEHFFKFVLAAEDVRNGKPHPEVYQTAVALAGAGPEQAVVAEDSASGLKAAVAASVLVASVRSTLSIDSPLFLGSYPDLLRFCTAIGVDV